MGISVHRDLVGEPGSGGGGGGGGVCLSETLRDS